MINGNEDFGTPSPLAILKDRDTRIQMSSRAAKVNIYIISNAYIASRIKRKKIMASNIDVPA